MKRPYPQRISQWNNMDEIIYKCPTCGISFGFYGKDEHYCHNCGEEILWRNLPTHCPEEIKNKYHNAKTVEESEKVMEELIDWLKEAIKNDLGKD